MQSIGSTAALLAVLLTSPAMASDGSMFTNTASESVSPLQSRGKRAGKKAVVLTPYLGDYESAKKASREQNVPLLVHIILEGEAENDTYRDTILPHKELIAASEFAVILIANNGEHDLKTIKERIEGREVESQVCSKYPWFQNCAQHRAPWDDLYMAYHDEAGDLSCPQTILLSPTGEKSYRKHDGHPPAPKDVLTQLKAAQKVAGPGLSGEQLKSIKGLEKDAKRSTDGKLWGAAWREWQGVLEITEVGLYAEKAEKAQSELEAEMTRHLEGLAARLVPGTAVESYAELVRLKEDWRETPVVSEAVKLMKRAEKDKAIKDAIRDWRFEQEAQALLDEALAFEEAKDEKNVRKALRKLFGKKYAATKAHAEAKKAFPQHAPDSDS